MMTYENQALWPTVYQCINAFIGGPPYSFDWLFSFNFYEA